MNNGGNHRKLADATPQSSQLPGPARVHPRLAKSMPRVRSASRDSASEGPAPSLLSRPQKRRRRLERRAAFKAIDDMKEKMKPAKTNMSESNHCADDEVRLSGMRVDAPEFVPSSVETRLAFIEKLLVDLHWVCVGSYCYDNSFDGEGYDGIMGPNIGRHNSHSAGKDDAPTCINVCTSATPTPNKRAVCTSTDVGAAAASSVVTATCNKCKEPHEECFCWQLLCYSCLRSADNCDCESPKLRHHICAACGPQCEIPLVTLNSHLDLPLNPNLSCQSCGGTALADGGWNFIEASDHECGKCCRRDGQQSLQWCDGKGCLANQMFHTYCMIEMGTCASDDQKFLCAACTQAGADFDVESASSDTSAQSSRFLVGDFRTLPNSCWNLLYDKFLHKSSSTDDQQPTNLDDERDQLAETLQSRLDYMIQFLEGRHIKSSSMSESHRQFILRKVKETIIWKCEFRTAQNVQSKINELDGLMSAIVRRL